MNNNYLIPANSKKSMKIFGVFYKFDLILFGIGIFMTIIFLMILPIDDLVFAIMAILPTGLTGLLVFPVPNYHNVLTALIEIWNFYTKRQQFVWKGWCVTSEYEEEK